ncbi:hypothetical protein FACS1894186_6210 [Alphaproteobacteria bacterium]|nr:hypothetical protein FACS1894186_6210 [Alphaproteobacteria bacterium]
MDSSATPAPLPEVNIIGAGFAGLACAVRLIDAEYDGKITIWEASGHAGGRAASRFDPWLNRQVEAPYVILHAAENFHRFLYIIEAFGVLEPLDIRLTELGNPFSTLPKLMLNTAPSEAKPWLLISTIIKGFAGIRPYIAADSLDKDVLRPALDYLARYRVDFQYNRAWRPADGLPGFTVATMPAWWWNPSLRTSPIVVAHYQYDDPDRAVRVRGGVWIFPRDGMVSLRVNAAVKEARFQDVSIGQGLWERAYAGLEPLPPFTVIKEPKATLWVGRRLPRRLVSGVPDDPDLLLAGDWTMGGVSSLENAVASGFAAAEKILAKTKGENT